MRKYFLRGVTACLLFGLLSACVGVPKGIQPIQDFELQPFLGTWYELARLDHRFERGLSRVSANYSLNDQGHVRVLNRGYRDEEGEWKEAEGIAKFVGAEDQAHLKVSFFGPFYASYIIFELGDDYAFVSGASKDYLWLLSRNSTLDPALKQRFMDTAKANGFNLDEIIFVEH